MRRRDFVLASLALAAPLARAQAKPRRIGVLAVGVSSAELQQWAQLQFVALLRKAGLEDGRDIALEWRYAEGDATRLPALAEGLVREKFELIVASFNPSIEAAMRATRTIPIVMVNAIAPVEQGYVQSFARPGGNVTGTAWSSPETMGKIVEVLKEAAPRTARLAILGNDKFPGRQAYMEAASQAGKRLGMAVEYFGASRLEEVEAALKQVAAWKPQGLYVAFDTILIAALRQIAAFALKQKLASISTVPQFVEAGGFLYYGPDIEHLAERTASYVARILRGAKPGDLPVELPTNYRLIVSRKTAAEIGIKLPNAFLLRADRVIE
jgi:putative ABC transport system substrate-binding protein